MKANELIHRGYYLLKDGPIVRFWALNGCIYTLDGLCVGGTIADSETGDVVVWSGRDVWKEIQPIPLTAEILEKNFPNADKVAWWYADDYEDADDRITYEIHISGGALGINGFMWYVHELQHALRLCGLNDLADNFKI